MSWSFERKLRKLQKKRDRADVLYTKLYREAREANKGRDEIEEISGEARMDDQISAHEIGWLMTSELSQLAERYFIPLPSRDDGKYWAESPVEENSRHLTSAGISLVRDAIREEEKKRREINENNPWRRMILGFLPYLLGLLSAILLRWIESKLFPSTP
jgi:hypothetical protein